MTSSDEPKRTKKYLIKSAVTSILFALFISIFPVDLYMQYRKYGYIRTGRAGVIARGDMAHSMIYGMTAAVAFIWVTAAYIAVRSMMKIIRGEYSEIDEAPEFVICTKCGEAQRSKELVAGHCFKCMGMVECLEGYYDRHPELKPESKPADPFRRW